MSETFTVNTGPSVHEIPEAPPPPPANGTRRPKRVDVKASLEKRRAELAQIDKDLAAAEEDVAVLRYNRAYTLAWIATNEKHLGDKPARKARTAKKAVEG